MSDEVFFTSAIYGKLGLARQLMVDSAKAELPSFASEHQFRCLAKGFEPYLRICQDG